MGYFDIGDVIDTRDISLSQPFLDILAVIPYTGSVIAFFESSSSLIEIAILITLARKTAFSAK